MREHLPTDLQLFPQVHFFNISSSLQTYLLEIAHWSLMTDNTSLSQNTCPAFILLNIVVSAAFHCLCYCRKHKNSKLFITVQENEAQGKT